MSRQGAIATRETRTRDDVRARVLDKGLTQAAREAYDEELTRHVAKNAAALVRMLDAIGLPTENLAPFVLDDFVEWYPDESRVCVAFDGYLVNYVAPRGGEDEHVQLIVGRCSTCAKPASIKVSTLSHFARPTLSHHQRMQRDDYVCFACSRVPLS